MTPILPKISSRLHNVECLQVFVTVPNPIRTAQPGPYENRHVRLAKKGEHPECGRHLRCRIRSERTLERLTASGALKGRQGIAQGASPWVSGICPPEPRRGAMMTDRLHSLHFRPVHSLHFSSLKPSSLQLGELYWGQHLESVGVKDSQWYGDEINSIVAFIHRF